MVNKLTTQEGNGLRRLLIMFAAVVGLTMSLDAAAEVDQFSFKHITMLDGLSSNKVNNIYRDQEGFVWISTAWGLNQYDGYSMRHFLHDDTDSSSLSENNVQWVRDIAGERLLVKMFRHFAIFDKHTEKFEDVTDAIFREVGPMPHESVVMVDSENNIWIAQGAKCMVYSTTDNTFLQNDIGNYTGGNGITDMTQCGDLRMAVYGDGTIAEFGGDLNTKYAELQHYSTPLENEPEGKHKLLVDHIGNIWVSTDNVYGVWRMDKMTNTWTHLTYSKEGKIRVPDFVISGMVEDTDGRIWIASDHGGINVIDQEQGVTYEIRSRKNDSRSLASDGVNCITADSQGCIWLGDVSLGVSVYAEPMFKFQIDDLSIDQVDRDFVAQVNCIAEDTEGHVWYGTDKFGVLRIDEKTGEQRLFRANANDASALSSDIIVGLCPDNTGGMWIGTYLGGLCHWNGSRFERYKGRSDVAPAAAFENIWTACYDPAGNFYVGSLGKGIAVRNAATGQWKQYIHDPEGKTNGLTSDFVMKIVCLKDGRMMIGTSEGVCVLDGATGAFSDTKWDPVLSSRVVDLFCDSRGQAWVCSENGVHVLDGKDFHVLTTLDHTSGLLTDMAMSVMEDARREVWVATTYGITNVDLKRGASGDSIEVKTYHYNEQDGFISGSVNERSICRLKSGKMVVGRYNGINSFVPENIRYNNEVPVVHITGLSVLGHKVGIGEEIEGHALLDEALTYKERIELPYGVNMFNIVFSTLSNILPEKVTYNYKLEGLSDKWITTKQNNVRFTNLTPGTYTFRIGATNCDGLASKGETTLQITVLPPWWRTVWAYLLYALLIVGIVFFAIKHIRDRDRAKFRLQQILDEVEHQKEVDDMKLRFFTNVSHELRTPLSLIISPLENILDNMPATDANHQRLELIHRNSQKLLSMVNQLLDFRKTEQGGMTLNLSEGDLVGFLRMQSEQFATLANRAISFSFVSTENSIFMKFDEDKMGKIITNLLSNAYKFTEDGGKVNVSVSLTGDGFQAVVKVTDTGIGIADEHKGHIFERFYQVPSQDASVVGTGIGLHLVKEFVQMHNGSIDVGDNLGGGTVMTVLLPVSRLSKSDEALAAAKTYKSAMPAVMPELPSDKSEEEDEEEVSGGGKPKILIVDDNADFLTILKDSLMENFDISEAKNGQEALDVIAQNMPDMVITDVMMPVMDGNELCKRIKTDINTSHIPVIMLTAKTAEEHRVEGLENGADDYLTKPFNPRILRLKGERLIELGRRRQETFKTQLDPEPSQITITPLDEQLISKAIAYVEQNIASPDLSVEDLSRHLGMSRVHLYKKLMSITGRPPIEFIRVIRLKRASQMLKDPQQNVADVAYAVGFNNPKYFSKYFKEEFGVLPSRYGKEGES